MRWVIALVLGACAACGGSPSTFEIRDELVEQRTLDPAAECYFGPSVLTHTAAIRDGGWMEHADAVGTPFPGVDGDTILVGWNQYAGHFTRWASIEGDRISGVLFYSSPGCSAVFKTTGTAR